MSQEHNKDLAVSRGKRLYEAPRVQDFFEPPLVVLAASLSGAACAAPPKMPPPGP